MAVDFSGKVDWASRANFEVDKRMLELGDKIRDAVITKLMNELWYPPSEANHRLSAGRVLLRLRSLLNMNFLAEHRVIECTVYLNPTSSMSRGGHEKSV
jgi:hypothetical protein